MSTESISFQRPLPVAAVKAVGAVPFRGRDDPGAAEAAVDAGAEADPALARAVEELNRYVAGSRTDLRFSIDRDAGQVVVSIVDAESGQVLRQMPSVEALRIARYLEHDRLGLIRQRA